jgi:hypothetical protein
MSGDDAAKEAAKRATYVLNHKVRYRHAQSIVGLGLFRSGSVEHLTATSLIYTNYYEASIIFAELIYYFCLFLNIPVLDRHQHSAANFFTSTVDGLKSYNKQERTDAN